MDRFIFEQINNLAHLSPVLDLIGIFLASYLQYFLIILLLSFLFWPKVNKNSAKKTVLVAFASGALSRLILTPAIRFFIHRPRPFLAIPSVKQLIVNNEGFSSFPSGHASLFFALAMGAYFYNKKLGILLFAGAIFMGIARVFVGVHWPSDIIGGALLGISAAWVTNMLAKRIFQNKNFN